MRFALISLHTSPLSQPGVGDAGGLNVYVNQVARQLVAHGHEVVIFTRATAGEDEVTVLPGLTVVNIPAGPADLPKADLPAITTAFAFRIMQWLVARRFTVDVFYSHYWLSGQAAYLLMESFAGQSRGQRPLWIHTAHTLAAAKNAAALQAGDPTFPTEPESRIVGEAELVARVDLLVANTEQERADLINYCHADPERIVVASPGIDETIFHPANNTAKQDPPLIAYVGRLQSFKGPQVLLRAAAQLTHPFQLVLCGGSSGNSREEYQALARELGIEDRVSFQDPLPPKQLAELYRKATLLVVPSYNETFGLVAMEAQACGTPVVAAKVGGLPYTVRDRITGLLVENHEPSSFAAAITELLSHPELTERLGAQAAAWGAEHTWTRTVETLLQNCGIFLNSTQRLLRPWHSGVMTEKKPGKLILLRHGQSQWNATNQFTGWVDVPLTEKGKEEATRGGVLLKEQGILPDVVFTSLQRRAIWTANLALDAADRLWIPVVRDWRLNERHYGALQGLNKAETKDKYGDDQFMAWRRSYDTPPPPLADDSEFSQAHDPRYAHLDKVPNTECLKDVVERFVPYFESEILPRVLGGETVLIAAHGNSLRALVKHLDGISDADIAELNIPTGIPLVYELDEQGKVLNPGGTYLDPEAAAAGAAAVAAQGGK